MPESDPIGEPFTLDPPGSIAVIGGGPLGIEAALYGRFLGYNIKVFEAKTLGANLIIPHDESIPMLPDRCLSNLAVRALQTQSDEIGFTFPLTINTWVTGGLIPLAETDLLRGRVHTGCHVHQLDFVPVELDDSEEDLIPADFQLTYSQDQGEKQQDDFESVIIATGTAFDIKLSMEQDAPYLFRIGAHQNDDWEQGFTLGLQEISAIFAKLGGRSDLDLYRPQRL